MGPAPRLPRTRFEGVAYWTEERDLRLAAEAARTGGVVTASLLRTCGFSKPAIQSAVRRGVLTRWGRGVYLVGPLTDELTEARAGGIGDPARHAGLLRRRAGREDRAHRRAA